MPVYDETGLNAVLFSLHKHIAQKLYQNIHTSLQKEILSHRHMMDMDMELLIGIISELHRKGNNAENIRKLLQMKGFDHLPLDTDVSITDPKNSLHFETWTIIFAKDQMNSLKVLLPPKLSMLITAELFMKGYELRVKKCMKYILGQVPTLVHTRMPFYKFERTLLRFAFLQHIFEGYEEGVQLLDMLLEENSSTGKTLLEQATPAGCAGETLQNLYVTSYSGNLAHVVNATKVLTNRYKEEVRIYRDNEGSSLLHILLLHKNRIFQNCLQYIIPCVKQLLSIGIDPTLQNNHGKTALDTLITSTFADNCVPSHLSDIPDYMRSIEAHLECLQWCTGTYGEINIPKLKSNYPSCEALSHDLAQL